MPISKKIVDEIKLLDESDEFKRLLVEILEKEDQGNHRNNKGYESLVATYIKNNYDVSDDEDGGK